MTIKNSTPNEFCFPPYLELPKETASNAAWETKARNYKTSSAYRTSYSTPPPDDYLSSCDKCAFKLNSWITFGCVLVLIGSIIFFPEALPIVFISVSAIMGANLIFGIIVCCCCAPESAKPYKH